MKTTPIQAKDIRVGTTLRIDGGTWIVKSTTQTKFSIVAELDGYFATWYGSGHRQLVFRKTDILNSVPHPSSWTNHTPE